MLQDKIVVLEHPSMYDRHVVAKVVKETEKTLTVQYWNVRLKYWNEDARRCNKPRKTIVLGNAGFIHEHNIQFAAERLIAFNDQLIADMKKAREMYFANVYSLDSK